MGTIRVTGLVAGAVTEWGGLMPSESPPCMGMHGESQATLVETKDGHVLRKGAARGLRSRGVEDHSSRPTPGLDVTAMYLT